MKLELALAESGLKCSNQLTTEDTTKHFDREKEGSARRDPAIVIRGEAAGGDYAVNVRMMLQSLIPSVQRAKEADVSAEMARIAGNL